MIRTHGRRTTFALLPLFAGVISSCGEAGGGDPLFEPWKGEAWISYALFEYSSLPVPATSTDRSAWDHKILGNARLLTNGRVYASLDEVAGAGTAEALRAMDTSALRAKYMQALAAREELLSRVTMPESESGPIRVLSLSIQHWSEERATKLIEEPSHYTPLYGAVLLPVGADPAVPDSPELVAFVAQLLRIHGEWERY